MVCVPAYIALWSSMGCVALTRANQPETRAASPATLHVIAAQGMQRVSATLCLVYVDACMCVLVLVRVRVRVRACVEVCMALLPRCCLHLFPTAEPLPVYVLSHQVCRQEGCTEGPPWSVCLRWWQHMVAKRTHRPCKRKKTRHNS